MPCVASWASKGLKRNQSRRTEIDLNFLFSLLDENRIDERYTHHFTRSKKQGVFMFFFKKNRSPVFMFKKKNRSLVDIRAEQDGKVECYTVECITAFLFIFGLTVFSLT